MIAGCETQTNWYQVPDGHHFSDLVGMGEDRKGIAAHNVHDKTQCQPGGTLIATYGRWTTLLDGLELSLTVKRLSDDLFQHTAQGSHHH